QGDYHGDQGRDPAPDVPAGSRTCLPDYPFPAPGGYTSIGNPVPDVYQATIRTDREGGSTYRDNGVTDVSILMSCLPSGCPAGVKAFFETFTSSHGPVLYPSDDSQD